jgi:hypothetical protein
VGNHPQLQLKEGLQAALVGPEHVFPLEMSQTHLSPNTPYCAILRLIEALYRMGSVLNLLLIELFLKQIKWLEAHTNIVETLPTG